MKKEKKNLRLEKNQMKRLLVFAICIALIASSLIGCHFVKKESVENTQELLRKSVSVQYEDGKSVAVFEVPNISSIISHKPKNEDTDDYLLEILTKGDYETSQYQKKYINEDGDDVTETVVDTLIQDEFTAAINMLLKSEE